MSQDLETAYTVAKDFLKAHPFLSLWLSTNSQRELGKRFNATEIIGGFKNVEELNKLLENLSREIRVLKGQHEYRMKAHRDAA